MRNSFWGAQVTNMRSVCAQGQAAHAPQPAGGGGSVPNPLAFGSMISMWSAPNTSLHRATAASPFLLQHRAEGQTRHPRPQTTTTIEDDDDDSHVRERLTATGPRTIRVTVGLDGRRRSAWISVALALGGQGGADDAGLVLQLRGHDRRRGTRDGGRTCRAPWTPRRRARTGRATAGSRGTRRGSSLTRLAHFFQLRFSLLAHQLGRQLLGVDLVLAHLAGAPARCWG